LSNDAVDLLKETDLNIKESTRFVDIFGLRKANDQKKDL
jgi:hypothetical protein